MAPGFGLVMIALKLMPHGQHYDKFRCRDFILHNRARGSEGDDELAA